MMMMEMCMCGLKHTDDSHWLHTVFAFTLLWGSFIVSQLSDKQRQTFTPSQETTQ